MKKIIMLAVIAAAVLGLAGCNKADKAISENAMMIIVDSTSGYTIYANKDTGVMYFCRDAGYGKSVCVMLNADGTPQIWEG